MGTHVIKVGAYDRVHNPLAVCPVHHEEGLHLRRGDRYDGYMAVLAWSIILATFVYWTTCLHNINSWQTAVGNWKPNIGTGNQTLNHKSMNIIIATLRVNAIITM